MGSMAMTTKRKAFDAAIAAWNDGDLDGYLELYSPSIKLHGYSDAPMSKAEASAMYRGIWDGVSDIHLLVQDVVEDETSICARCTMTGRHTGILFGVPGTDRPIAQSVITILRFEDAQCVERWSVADTLGVLLQIGAITLPS